MFEEALIVGAVALGARRVLITRHGSFNGEHLRGDVLAGGSDWVLHRPDGAAELDIRFTLRMDDGDLICMSSRGIFDASNDVAQQFRSGHMPEPDEYYFRTAVFFETASQKHRRLNRIVALGNGMRTLDGMETDDFEVV